MSSRDTTIPRAMTVTGVEAPERLFRRSHRNPSNNRRTGLIELDGQEQASLSTGDEPECDASYRVFSDQVVSEGKPVNIKTASVTSLTSEQLLICYKVAGSVVRVEKAVNTSVLKVLTASWEGVDNRL